jgi:predicted RNA-binding Zn-ribbon protein involved in translation (DUF1610 family)
MNGPKVGLIDIETAPLDANVWGLFDQNVGLNQIRSEWSILSFTYKQLGASKRSLTYMDTQGSPRDDRAVCAALWDIMHDNDFLIAQNGKRFDARKIRARLIMHGFTPHRPVKIIDTMLMARQVAAFTSNKLEWLTTYLSSVQKLKHKDFPGFDLWTECLADNPKAWASMRKYNIVDVLSMEDVYMRLRGWVTGHPNFAAYYDDEKTRCPVCGSEHLIKSDTTHKTNVSEYNQFQCGDCGAWSRDRYTINSKAKRRSLLANQ